MDNLFETKEMPGAFKRVREKLLKTFPKERIEGLNLRRVESFIRSLGLELKPYVIFDRDQLPVVKQIGESTRLLRDVFDNRVRWGFYNPEIDMVLIARDRNYEEINGPVHTEGLLVHELAHASSMYRNYVTFDNIGFYTPRVGFCLPQNKIPWGWFFEEGWAEYHRGRYVMKYSTPQFRERLIRALEVSHVNLSDMVYVENSDRLPLPIKYIYLKPDGTLTANTSSLAAFGVELLFSVDPGLYEVMKTARSSVDGLRKLGRVIERIEPGLYLVLSKTDYTEEDFFEKLKLIILKGKEWGIELIKQLNL